VQKKKKEGTEDNNGTQLPLAYLDVAAGKPMITYRRREKGPI
jgi:hypothetical protein